MYDIAIIGAGPGGYIAAIRAAQLGAKVALIEKENVGGTCLNWGCIPSKAVLSSVEKYHTAQKMAKFGITCENLSFDYKKISERKWQVVEKIRKGLNQLIKSYKIDLINGEATIKSANKIEVKTENDATEIDFKNLIIATGSRPISLPGLEIDHDFILDTNDILKLDELPETIMVVGSGASGIEWTRIFNTFGKKVILVELAENLAPMFDKDISQRLDRVFKKQRVEFYTGTKVESIEGKTIKLSNGKEFTPDIIFLAAGRAPNSDINGLENLGIDKERNYIKVDSNLKTNINNVYAIGDVTGIFQVAHVASHQGVKAVEHILENKPVEINYNAVPSIVYGNPEVCSVGFTEQRLQTEGKEYEISLFPVSAIGRTIVEEEIDGLVKVIASKDKILGVHIIGDQASGMIQQAAIAINSGLTPEQMKEVIFAHPTYSEALYEAFLGIDGLPLHLPKVK